MLFTKSFVLCVSLVASAVAQTAQNSIAFTSLPASVQAGQPVKLTWSGGDNTPVTITLKQGDPGNLQTVSLITGSGSNGSYEWTPSSSFPNAKNYALQITQDETDINYTGLFSLTGGSSSSGSSSSGSSSAASATASTSATASSGSTPIVGGGSSNSTSSNTTTVAATNATTTAAASAGTGSSIARNTTMSIATLTSSTGSSSASSPSSTDSGSGGSSSSAGTAPSGSSTPKSAASVMVGNVCLVLAIVAGVVVFA